MLPQASPTADLGDLRPDEPRGEAHLPMGIDALVWADKHALNAVRALLAAPAFTEPPIA